MQKKRVYQSAVRQRQADDTRMRIVGAARTLLERHGYSGMTMEAVSQEAGVAVPTVYAIFKSKTGLLSEILDASRFSDTYQTLVREAMQTPEPRDRIKFAARIARRVYEGEDSVLDLFRGAGAVAPALARKEAERERTRYDGQKMLVAYIAKSGGLRPGLDEQKARDILWSLTSRDLYRMLVRDRKWTPDDYEKWLAETLAETLTTPARSARN